MDDTTIQILDSLAKIAQAQKSASARQAEIEARLARVEEGMQQVAQWITWLKQEVARTMVVARRRSK